MGGPGVIDGSICNVLASQETPGLTVTPADLTTRGETTRPTSRKEEAHATMPKATCFPPQGTCSHDQLPPCCGRSSVARNLSYYFPGLNYWFPGLKSYTLLCGFRNSHPREQLLLLLLLHLSQSFHSRSMCSQCCLLCSRSFQAPNKVAGRSGRVSLPPKVLHIFPIGGSPMCFAAAQAMRGALRGTSSRELRLAPSASMQASHPCSCLQSTDSNEGMGA